MPTSPDSTSALAASSPTPTLRATPTSSCSAIVSPNNSPYRATRSGSWGSRCASPRAGSKSLASWRDATVDWIAQRVGRSRDALEVTVGLDRLERAEQTILLSKLILGLLVLLMLVIGGIGIMNVLLASVAVAFGATALFRAFTEAQIYPVFRVPTVALAVVSAVFVGVTFGVYPALIAARLTPIEAIQRE